MIFDVNDLIYGLTQQSLGEVPFHHESSLLTRLTAHDFPYHVAIHQVDAQNEKADEKGQASKPDYVDEHFHDYIEINLLLSEKDELIYDFTIDGKVRRVKSPGIVFIPPNTRHSANVVQGVGSYICIIMASTDTVFGHLKTDRLKAKGTLIESVSEIEVKPDICFA